MEENNKTLCGSRTENASIKFASGSGLYSQYCGNCLFKCETNRSISGVKFNVSRVVVIIILD